MNTLMQAADGAPYLSSLSILIGVGFIAAVTIGSIAWYNSKRPAGWEDKERPDIVPEVEK
ncbi:MAG: photosystem II assembly protein Psb35 [Leptolyngbyaceae cyanobacterium]